MGVKQPLFKSDFLKRVTEREPSIVAPLTCVTVCHNEVLIIRQFLEHYRKIGCGHFLIVDDNSDDGTFEFLAEQKDVTLFQPANGARFSDCVGKWRQQLLDYYCVNRWVTLPDVDELMYYKQMPAKLPEVIEALEGQGEEALLAVMLDMYDDKPLSSQKYTGERPLEDEFPFFDGQGMSPMGIRIGAQPSSYLKKWPTPPVCIMGGVRERLFFQKKQLNFAQEILLSKFSHARRPLNPSWINRLQNRLTRVASKRHFSDVPFVLNKFALLKWREGTRFPRAPHAIDRKVKVSEGLAVFLHFKFYKGIPGLEYSLERKQHAGESSMYSKMLEHRNVYQVSPITPQSRKFDGLETLEELLR